MSNPVISGNGIFSHVFIGAVDVQKSAEFCHDATLGALVVSTTLVLLCNRLGVV